MVEGDGTPAGADQGDGDDPNRRNPNDHTRYGGCGGDTKDEACRDDKDEGAGGYYGLHDEMDTQGNVPAAPPSTPAPQPASYQAGLATIQEEDEDEGERSNDNQYADGGETDKPDSSPHTPRNQGDREHGASNNHDASDVGEHGAVVEAPPYPTMYAMCQYEDNASYLSNNWSSPSPLPTVPPFDSNSAGSSGKCWYTEVPEPTFRSTTGFARGTGELLEYGLATVNFGLPAHNSGRLSFEQQMILIEQQKALQARRYRARQFSNGYVNPRESVLGFDIEAHSPNGHDQPYVRVEDPAHESMKQYRRRYGY